MLRSLVALGLLLALPAAESLRTSGRLVVVASRPRISSRPNIVAQGGHEYTPDKYAPVPTSITQLPVSTTALDTLIAAVAAGSAFWLLSYLEAASGIPMYAPPLAASSMIMFSGSKPLPAQNVFLGTVGGVGGSYA